MKGSSKKAAVIEFAEQLKLIELGCLFVVMFFVVWGFCVVCTLLLLFSLLTNSVTCQDVNFKD